MNSHRPQSGVHNEYFLHHRRRGRCTSRCRLLGSALNNKILFDLFLVNAYVRDFYPRLRRRSCFACFVRIIGLTGSIDLGRRFSRYVAATLGVVATQEPVGAALPMRQWARPLKISTNKPRSKNCRSRQAVLILALFFSVRVQCYCTRLLRLSHKRDGDGVACVHPSQTRCPCAADRSPCAIAIHWRRHCDHRLFAISRSRRHLQIIGARGSEILPCIGMEEIREHKLFAICRSERHLQIIGAGGS